MTIYCEDCQILICLECRDTDHNGHNVTGINKKYNEIKKSINDETRLDDYIMISKMELEHLHERKNQNKREYDRQLAAIKEQVS